MAIMGRPSARDWARPHVAFDSAGNLYIDKKFHIAIAFGRSLLALVLITTTYAGNGNVRDTAATSDPRPARSSKYPQK